MSKRSDEQLSKVKAIVNAVLDDHGEVALDNMPNWLGRKMGELLACVDAAVADLDGDNSELRRATRAKLDGLTDRVAKLEGDGIRHGAMLDALAERVTRGEETT